MFTRAAAKNEAGVGTVCLCVFLDAVWVAVVVFFSIPVLLDLFGFLPADAPIRSVRRDFSAGVRSFGAELASHSGFIVRTVIIGVVFAAGPLLLYFLLGRAKR